MKSLIHTIIKVVNLLEFTAFYIKEVILSNFRVAYDVVTPTNHMRPAILKVSVQGMSDRQILFAANLITMTPGTLTVDVTSDKNHLKVHSMYVDDPKTASDELETQYLRRIRNVF